MRTGIDDVRAWGAQRFWWSEHMRGGALAWPREEKWFVNDPLDHAPHSHPDASEIYFVAAGRLDVTVGEERLRLEAGDLCLIPADAYHDPHGTDGSDLALFVVVAPNWRGRRWRTEDFPPAAFAARGSCARVGAAGPLPSDERLAAACLSLALGESHDASPAPGGEAVLYVLEGELEVTLDRLHGRLAAHEYLHVPANARCVARAGAQPAHVLKIISI